MQIHINRDGQNYGPYSLDEARQYLASGNLTAADLAWFEGAQGWMPLGHVPGLASAAQGAQAAAQAAAPRVQRAVVAPASTAAAAASANGSSHAGFWRRVVAYLVDGTLFAVVSWIISAVFGVVMFNAIVAQGDPAVGMAMGLALLMQVIFIVAAWLYFALMESSPGQATLGKRAVGLVVTDLDGGRISFGRASGRFFGKILSALVLGIGFLMAGFTARRQGLHDMLASTVVLNKDPSDTQVPWWGWVVIGLYVALPLLGMVAAVLIPGLAQ